MTQCIFPTELVFAILLSSNPQDVVRWRTVSKWFRAITHDTALWKALYVNATFPHPPCSFASKSRGILERDLVKSAQLAQSWTTRPMRTTSSLKIKTGCEPEAPAKLVCGRWLVACESNRKIVLHEADPKSRRHSQRILWESETPVVYTFDVATLTSIERQCLYVLIRFDSARKDLPSWLLSELLLDGNTAELHSSATIQPPAFDSHGSVSTMWRTPPFRARGSRFLFIPLGPDLLFDTQEHTFYRQPPFRIALGETETISTVQHEDPIHHKVLLTDSHFICLWFYSNLGIETLIQVFALPPDNAPGENGERDLLLTNEAYFDEDLLTFEIMSDPSTDPLTGATTIRLLEHHPRRVDGFHVRYIDLVLLKASTNTVLPITIELHKINIPHDDIQPKQYFRIDIHLDPSHDGRMIRGFFIGKPRRDVWDPPENNHVMKFSIDVTQDPWEITCGKLAPAEWDYDENPEVYRSSERHIYFDGMRGRLCYDDPSMGYQIIVADIE